MGERCGDAVQDAFDVDVDHLVPFVHPQTIHGRKRHDARVVDEHVDPSVGLNGRVDQLLQVVLPRHVGDYGSGLVAGFVEFGG
jgi:hypothetical protein